MDERHRLTTLSLRTRMVGLAALLVTVVLVLGGVLLGVGLRALLLQDLETTAALRSEELASLAARGALPEPVPIADQDEALVQVVGRSGVVASSANIRNLPPLHIAPAPALGQSRVERVERLPVEEERSGFVVALTTTRAPEGLVTVAVAISSEEITETLGQAVTVGLVALPLLVAGLSSAVWVVVTRTLAPVEGIRAQAEAISGTQLHRRVPEPPRSDEVGRLARTLNAMLARLEDSARRQRSFVADAAHELRSPIASVRAQIETARDSPRKVDWRQVAAGVLDETLRMEHLTEQLLLLARADAGQLLRRHETVDLDDVVDVVTSQQRSRGTAPFVDIRRVEPVQVNADRMLLERLVGNLVDNACRYARSSVSVSLHTAHGGAVLTVDDDGPGIPPEERSAVFERFHRLGTARDRLGGSTGLGLAIVADIAHAHGGTVTAAESPLGGARFTVRLPIGGTGGETPASR